MSDRSTPAPGPVPVPRPASVPWPLLADLDSLSGRIALSAESIEAIGRVADLLTADRVRADHGSPPACHVLDLLTHEVSELRAMAAELDALVSGHRAAADADSGGRDV